MALTYGFYNSFNHDRIYDAVQVSEMFDGLITDGVFSTIGKSLVVRESEEDNMVVVQPGKAWFNHTWTKVDADYPVTASESTLALDRIDALVLDINSAMAARENKIIFVEGTPGEEPQRPELINDAEHHQYPLAYVYRHTEQEHIYKKDITNMVGTNECPFVVAMLKTISLDELLGQWRAQLDDFVASEEADFSGWKNQQEEDYSTWSEAEKATFVSWFGELKDLLSEDVAGKLTVLIRDEEIGRIITSGFTDGTKVFSDDGTVITFTASDSRKLVKTFTDNFMTITSMLTSAEGGEIAKQVKKFSQDGKTIQITFELYL